MRCLGRLLVMGGCWLGVGWSTTTAALEQPAQKPTLRRIVPPEQGFFEKMTDYDGIPIKAAAVVDDRALLVAHDRLSRLLGKLPDARFNLRLAGAALHIIGRSQVTSDLPEHRHLRGKPFDGKLTVDERTRGLGGLLTSCGEENLLELPYDRYRGRDICIHEMAHNLQGNGLSRDIRQRIRDQFRKSTTAGLWKGAYAATNDGEFFAELSMWYFGTHGDLMLVGPKPENGPDGLRKYDPEAFALLDEIYSGRVTVGRVAGVQPAPTPPDREADTRSTRDWQATTILFANLRGETLHLYWLDGDGKRQDYGLIAAGTRRKLETSVGHAWLLTDEAGKGVAIFTAEMETTLAIVRP